MSHVIELSDESYRLLEQAATQRSQTVEALLTSLIAEESVRKRPIYTDVDDFFRSLGTSEEVITEANRRFAESELTEPYEAPDPEEDESDATKPASGQ